jgi:hypothetical protein
LTEKDIEALRIADLEIAQGDTLTHAEVLSHFGLESNNF